MGALTRMSPRAEKTVRLVVGSLVALGLGIPAVVLDNEVLGFAALAVLGVAILAGPAIDAARRRTQTAGGST